jgi:myo-inositol-hexaphosphate 3-phosphohydrolase/alpha-tubulin suppressor-like RCC1 family protein
MLRRPTTRVTTGMVAALTAIATAAVGAVALAPAAGAAVPTDIVGVPSVAETTPVSHSGDSADDPAIWVDPSDPAQSLVIGNDKNGALETYDLSGDRVQRITDPGGTWGNVDVRQDVQLGGVQRDIVAAMNGGIRFYAVDAATRTLSAATDGNGVVATNGEGLCLYHSPSTGDLYTFVVLPVGTVRQYLVTDSDQDGLLEGTLVRSFAAGGEAEGCAVDDATGALYLAEEDVALWRYGAEPTAGTDRTAVDTVLDSGGRLAPDIEGVTTARRPDGTGVLIASAQNLSDRSASYFAVYDLDGSNAYRGSFRVVNGTESDDCDGTDGIAAYAGALGSAFPDGLFVCQDNSNVAPGSTGNQDFKYASMAQVLAPPAQQAPDAVMSVSCNGLDCTFDGTGSTPAGQLSDYAWTFGDGAGATTASATHTYSDGGSYQVTLTVTDGTGAVDTATRTQTVTAADGGGGTGVVPVSFVAASSADGNSATGRVTVPSSVAQGDTLVLFASTGSGSIATPPGWTSVGSRTASPLVTSMFTRTASAGDAGATVTVSFPSLSKYGLVVAAYRGLDTDSPVAGLESAAGGSGTTRVTPTLSTSDPAWVVSYWTDRSSSVTGWSGPSTGVRRATVLGGGGGRITGLLSDSGTPVAAGTVGGVTAASNVSASHATMWTVALRPAASGPVEPVQTPPDAVLAVSCDQLQCHASSAGSQDGDGQIVSYGWSFGDGGTASGATADHTYASAGSYTVTLTVTDDDGLTGQASRSVTVTAAPPVEPPTATGTPYAWGGNDFGELGDATTTAHRTAAAVSGLSGVVDIDGGREHQIALTSSGTVYTWGSNEMGQLGLGGGGNRSTPTAVPGLSGIVATAAGHYHSLAVDAAGNVWAWGNNASGQLGDGTTTRRASPVRVSGLTNVVGIAAGRDMSYAIRSDGTVWAWGLNSHGELGDGTTTSRTAPVRVGSLTGVVAVAGGRDHGLALRSDGTVWGWGWNQYGQVGDGTTSDRSTPVQVATGMSAITAGAHHSYALRTDGQVMSWGRNYRDELGDGTGTTRTRPVQVTGVSGAVAIGSGRDHGLAVLADGSVMAWGYNTSGQLGDGTTTSRRTAVRVQGVSGATQVSAGAEYSVALVGGDQPTNARPVAQATVTCDQLSCSASASGSYDPDGQIASYAWTFGDGSGGAGAAATHDYAGAGTYQVTLTVTDDQGATGSTSRSVTVEAAPATGSVAFVAQAGSDANTQRARITVPQAVAAGDGLVLVASLASSDVGATTPDGWTLVDEATAGRLGPVVYRRTATASDAGSTVTLALSGMSKTSLQLVAYRGVGTGSFVDVTFATSTSSSTSRSAPATTVATSGSWVVSYWADRSSSDRTWTAPAGVAVRGTTYGTGGGRVSSLLADSGGPLSSGTYAARSATTSASSAQGIGATLVLRPAG